MNEQALIKHIKAKIEELNELLNNRYLDGYDAGRLEGQRSAYRHVLLKLGVKEEDE